MIRRPVTGPRAARWAVSLDVIISALLVLGIIVVETGGFRHTWFGLTLSVKRSSRPVILAVALSLIRWWVAPHVPVFGGRFRPLRADEPVAIGHPPLGVGQALVSAALAVVLTIIMTWPQARDLQSVPDLGDPLFSTWRLAWVAHQLPRVPLDLFNANIFYPEPGTLAFSDPTLVPALIAAPLFWFGVPPVAAYNVMFLSTFALGALFTFLFVRALVGRTDAAAVAAIIFAFYPYRFDQYSHLEQVTFWVPLGAWAFHRTIESGRLRDGLLAGAAIAAQFLSSIQHGLFFVAFLVPIAAVLWWARRPPLRTAGSLAAGVVLALLLVVPVAVPLLESRRAVGERPVVEVEYYSARPIDYFTAHPRNSAWGWTTSSYSAERCLFPGVMPIALAVVGLWPPWSAVRLAYAAALGFAVDLSLGFHGALYPLLYSFILPYRGLRVPARFGIFVGFALAVCAAYGVKRLTNAVNPGRRQALISAAIALLVLIEVHPSLELTPVWRQPPDVYRQLPRNAVLAEFPAPSDIGESAGNARYMYFSAFHWRRLLNGYSGFFPATYIDFMTRMRSFPNADTLAYLAERHADYIIVHGAFMDQAAYLGARSKLDASPAVALVERFSWEGREGSVYRLGGNAQR